ncbi:MAG: SLBB domain-containing protein [Chthonomonas sp.]|nr:SLBB domain-containing protein [Chthonomonas sp.]
MLRRALLPILLLIAIPAGLVAQTAAKLRSGDRLRITVLEHLPFSGEFRIMNDGSVSGDGFGRVVLAGKTLSQANEAIRAALAKRLKDPHVTVSLLEQRRDVVYIVNLASSIRLPQSASGATEIQPGTTVRQVLGGTGEATEPDRIRVRVMRGAQTLATATLAEVLRGPAGATKLQSEDVVIVEPAPQSRVWVTGNVARPGSILVPQGANVQQAVAAAGGINGDANDFELFVRRGPESIPVSLNRGPNAAPFALQDGDTLSIETPERVTVVVDGEVKEPKEVSAKRSDLSLEKLIAQAGGALPTATLSNVLIARQGETFRIDLNQLLREGRPLDFQIRSGDYIYVRPNERRFFVVGEVTTAGEFLMKDGVEVRLADALARANGLRPTGSLLRVAVARPDKNGKYVVTTYNLDRFIKDGKLDDNPVLQPDDVVYFGTPKGIRLTDVSTALSGLLIIRSLGR